MMPTLATIIQHANSVWKIQSDQSNQTNKKNKDIQNAKEELKLLMSTDKMIIYVEKP